MKYLSPSTFVQPRVITGSSSFGHTPFFFWLVDILKPSSIVELGTMFGYTFAIFCQASKFLQHSVKLFAIDTWEGDENTGKYDNKLYEVVRSMVSENFETSNYELLRMRFSDAVARFEHSSVDLLFIDGCHTYEAVKEDFETWRHTLSKRSVVLFHDTRVERPGFGVKRYWAEVAKDFPSFEFHHDHGLGVLITGEDAPEILKELACEPADKAAEIRKIYEAIGEKYQGQWDLRVSRRDAAKKEHHLATMEKSLSWRITAPLRWLDKNFPRS